jgi:hypothetical protein
VWHHYIKKWMTPQPFGGLNFVNRWLQGVYLSYKPQIVKSTLTNQRAFQNLIIRFEPS